MKIISALILILCLSFCVFAEEFVPTEEELATLKNFLPENVDKAKCITTELSQWKKSVLAKRSGNVFPTTACYQGSCGNPTKRDSYSSTQLEIPLVFRIICKTSGCAVNDNDVTAQLQKINQDFSGTGIKFVKQSTSYFVSSTYAELPAYSQSSSQWYIALLNLKQNYASEPSKYLNVFVSGQKSGSSGTLLGIGTFPWDSDAKSSTGGLWVNAAFFGAGETTAAHELGHNVGLWHTFHGVDEVDCNTACYEYVHPLSDTEANYIGDMCQDTPSQPREYTCTFTGKKDCKGASFLNGFTNTQLSDNIMSYTSCADKFTAQQSNRARCWVCDALSGYNSGNCATSAVDDILNINIPKIGLSKSGKK